MYINTHIHIYLYEREKEEKSFKYAHTGFGGMISVGHGFDEMQEFKAPNRLRTKSSERWHILGK